MTSGNSKDLTNSKIGKLLIIEKADKPKHLKTKNVTYYNCLCECGNFKIMSRTEIMKPFKSCGCSRKPYVLHK